MLHDVFVITKDEYVALYGLRKIIAGELDEFKQYKKLKREEQTETEKRFVKLLQQTDTTIVGIIEAI